MDGGLPLTTSDNSATDDEMSVARIGNGNWSTDRTSPSPLAAKISLGCYGLLFLVLTFVIAATCHKHPLFPIQAGSLEWNNSWLVATVFDYYGACLCFCGVVMSSEPSLATGLAWTAGCCLLGSPVCCLWVILRLRREGSLRLVDSSSKQ